jgi:hemerythrin superfamily protein
MFIMRWREVSREEYQEAFRRLRQIISLIENDPRLDYKGFELKQKLREIARTLVQVEKELYGEIWGLNGTK